MIASLWSNSNYDDDKGSRQTAIEEIEEKYETAVAIITLGYDPNEEEIDYDNPFFAPVKKGLERIEDPRDDEGLVSENVLYDPHVIDQG